MKYFHIPTLVILGGCIFCISEKHFERADAIQKYWTSTCLLLVLAVCFVCMRYNDKNLFPHKKVLSNVQKTTPCGDKFLKPHKSSSSSIPGV